MVGKTSVSALEEFCSKKRIPSPKYVAITDNGCFICRVELLNISADGEGRSKRDAKHAAAAAYLKKLRLIHPEVEIAEHDVNGEEYIVDTSKDQIILLRDYCVEHDIPLPEIEIIQQAGTPDAREFTCRCTIASITRYATSNKKKDARQKCANEMLRIISSNNFTINSLAVAEVGTMNTVADIEYERYLKFKTYRELISAKNGVAPGTRICDRHYYFQNFKKELKDKAWEVINNPENYDGPRTQAMELLKALKITPKITAYDPTKQWISVEFDCDYDVFFVAEDPIVFIEIIDYFKLML